MASILQKILVLVAGGLAFALLIMAAPYFPVRRPRGHD